MATAYSTLLGLALPVQGELSGTWGDTVNNYITTYLDAAVAGAQTITSDVAVTLTKTTGTALSATSSQYAILNCTGARTATQTINVPSTSKFYLVLNATTGGFGVKVVGAGPTTGLTIANATMSGIAVNGTDVTFVSSTDIAQLTGTLTVANGGTGATTLTSAGILRGNGTSAISVASATDIATAIGTTAVTNSTNAANVAIAADITSTAAFYIPYASAVTGNVAMKGTQLTVVPSTGSFTAVGNVTAYSDERKKTNWQNLPVDFIERIAKVKSGVYDRTDIDETQVGVSAQELQKVMPNAVMANDDGVLSVAYGNAALAAVVALAQKVVDLEARLAALES